MRSILASLSAAAPATAGQAAKFVKPGAVRLDSNSFGSGGLEDVAVKNPDGSHVPLVPNAGGSGTTAAPS